MSHHAQRTDGPMPVFHLTVRGRSMARIGQQGEYPSKAVAASAFPPVRGTRANVTGDRCVVTDPREVHLWG